MGRATEFFDYINRETHPSEREMNEMYFSLTVDDTTRRLRKENLKRLKEKKDHDGKKV